MAKRKKNQTPVEEWTPERLQTFWIKVAEEYKDKISGELFAQLNTVQPTSVNDIFEILDAHKDVIRNILIEYPRYLAFMSPKIRDNLDLVMMACKEYPGLIDRASSRIRDLKEIAEWSTQVKPPVLYLMSNRWSRDLEFQKKALRTHPFYIRQLVRYKGTKDNKELMKEAVSIHGYYLAYASNELRRDPELVCLAIKKEKKVSSRLKVDIDVLLSNDVLPTAISTDISWLFHRMFEGSHSVKNEIISKRLTQLESVVKTIPEKVLFYGFENLKESWLPEGTKEDRVTESLLKYVSVDFVVKVKELFPYSRNNYPENVSILDEIITSKRLLAIKKEIPLVSVTPKKRRILRP